ncbi:MAG: FkbM family methyltransferase [Nitrosarchaeum sp.]|nr:FkbM family methyltransferase [Nitrosarchaeum sp.]
MYSFSQIKRYVKLKLKKSPKDEPYIFRGMYDLKYQIHTNSSIDLDISKNGIINDWIVFNIKKLLKSNSVIFDIGANRGIYTLPFSKECPYSKIYAFEPDMESYLQLKYNLNLNEVSNVEVFNIALQENENVKKSNFYIRRCVDNNKFINQGISSLEKSKFNNISMQQVNCSTIDKIVLDNNLKRLDFIKLDAEGSEYRILQGGKTSICKYLPIVHYEFSRKNDDMMENSNSIKSFNFLKEIGYQQYYFEENIKNSHLINFPVEISDVNVLAIPKNNLEAIKIVQNK